MLKILIQAMENCALKESKGISLQRGKMLFDERLTMDQKIIAISNELQSMGYTIHKSIGENNESLITTHEGE